MLMTLRHGHVTWNNPGNKGTLKSENCEMCQDVTLRIVARGRRLTVFPLSRSTNLWFAPPAILEDRERHWELTWRYFPTRTNTSPLNSQVMTCRLPLLENLGQLLAVVLCCMAAGANDLFSKHSPNIDMKNLRELVGLINLREVLH